MVQITGVTKRTLHYYDEINLLKPTYLTEKGYRHYDRIGLAKLQMILLLKEMDFSLQEIKSILKLSREEQKQLLKKHSQALLLKKQRLETVITAIDEYVSGKDIANLQIFNHSSILPLQEQYAREAKFIYGDTEAYKKFETRQKQLTSSEREKLLSSFEQNMENICRTLASCMDQSPSSDEVQRIIVDWKKLLEQVMVCDAELLACIANTYQVDSRYKNYINRFSAGGDLAEFLYKAIMHHIHQIE